MMNIVKLYWDWLEDIHAIINVLNQFFEDNYDYTISRWKSKKI
jgi:hypothetical protein